MFFDICADRGNFALKKIFKKGSVSRISVQGKEKSERCLWSRWWATKFVLGFLLLFQGPLTTHPFLYDKMEWGVGDFCRFHP